MGKFIIGWGFISVFALNSLAFAQQQSNMKPKGPPCQYWQSMVDEDVQQTRETIRPDLSDERVVIGGMRCLLEMKGNKHLAKFSGAVNDEVSQIFDHTTADVAALYYISYLFYQRWEHANAVALRGKDGAVNTPETIAEAYRSYEAWFEKVKQVGLMKARKLNLDPLQDSKVRWY